MQLPPVPMRVRVIFVLAAVLFIAQSLFIHQFGQPYPALIMPGFQGSGGYRDGRVELTRYEAAFVTKEEDEFTFPPKVLLEEFPPSHHGAIGASLTPYRQSPQASAGRSRFGRIQDTIFPGYAAAVRSRGSPEHLASLRSWLRVRARALLPGRQVTRVEIRWFRERVLIDGTEFRTEREPTGTLLISLDGELK